MASTLTALSIPFISSASELGDLCHQLGFDYYLPGAEKSPSARVFIALGHNDERIFAKFSVSEPAVRAINTKDQDPVYQDSCVEIFVSHPGLNGQYCNFEFNCIGTCLAAVGSCREARTSLSPSLMSKVIRTSSLGSVPFEEKAINAPWTLDVEIPSEAFMAKAPLSSLTDFRINVYKCGDKLLHPHWQSLFPITTEVPNFHRPDCFQPVVFLSKSK